MSARKLKVPSSARRHIKLEHFSQFVSVSRLRHVQSILTNRKAGSADIDGILCIAGIDSRYNEGMYELLNYLLFGFFDTRKEELESSGFPEEVIEDIIILICCDHVQVYCNPINYHYLLPYVSHWSGIQFHCLSENQLSEEDDEAEEFKIRSFITMITECNLVGIPFSGQGHTAEFNAMDIEKWPIIQAFALEEFGGNGFFTMKHEVVDISSQVHQLQDFQDSVSLELLLTDHFPLISRQWNNMLQGINLSLESNTTFLSQKKISEPLRSYFNHGFVGHKGRVGKIPFVLFNHDKQRQQLEDSLKGIVVELSDSPLKTQCNLHMVCQIASPHKPLVCARTYFFCNQPYGFVEGWSGDRVQQHGNVKQQLRYSIKIYLSMIDAVLVAIKEYCQSYQINRAKEKCIKTLMKNCCQLDCHSLLTYMKDGSNIQFKLIALNSNHSEETLANGEANKKIKFISLTLYDIPAFPNSGKDSIGSMLFAETFLDSCIRLSGSLDVNSNVFVLTSSIPRHHIWSLLGHTKRTSCTPPNLPSNHWGDHLMTHDDIHMMSSWAALLPPEKVILSVWTNGILVHSSDYGSIPLHCSDINLVSLYDGDSMSKVTFLILEINISCVMADYLPVHLCHEVDDKGLSIIILAFNPHTKSHTQLYGNVLPVWKKNSQFPSIKRLTELDSKLQYIHECLQKKIDFILSGSTSQLKKISGDMPGVDSFLQHLTVSCGLYGSVTKDVYYSLNDATEGTQEVTEEKIVITIIGGAPGSGKIPLTETLSSFNTNIINWVVYKQTNECQVDMAFLHQTMTSAAHMLSQFILSKTTRLIIVAPGFIDTTEVLRAIRSLSDQRLRSLFVVGAVTICIDPLNTYMEHKLTLPMLTAQCAQGWVNNIVFTSQTSAPSEELNSLQTLIRSINNDVAMLKAENGQIKRSSDLDLIMSESAFSEAKMERARVLLKPYWREGYPHACPCRPQMKDVTLYFTNPLEKHFTLINLRNLKKNFRSHPFTGNIYFVNGLLAFSGSPKLVNLQFSPLNGKLILNDVQTVHPSGDSPSYTLTFCGVNLKEQDLKSFLSTCIKQKPEKKKLLNREDLSKQEIDKIHTSHHLDPLPEGWYYNGSQFVNMDGERSVTHPNLDLFISQYLEKKNQDVAQFNSRIESESYISLWQQ